MRHSRLLQLVPDKNAALLQQRYEAARLLDRHFHGSIKPDRVFNNASAAERQRLRMQLQLELNRLPFAHLLVDSDSDDDEGDRSSLTHRSAGGAVIEQHGVVRPEKNTEKPLRKQGSITLGNQSQPVTPNSGGDRAVSWLNIMTWHRQRWPCIVQWLLGQFKPAEW